MTLPEELFKKGLQLVQQNDPSGGMRVWEQCIQEHPDFWEVYGHLAWLYLNQERYHPAEQIYRRIIQHSPEDAEAHFCLGLVLLHRSKPVEAKAEYNTALRLAGKVPSQVKDTWCKQWKEHKKACSGRYILSHIRQFLDRHPILNSCVGGVRSLIFLITLLILKLYDPLVRSKLLPQYVNDRRRYTFSITHYLRFLLRSIQCRHKFKLSYARVAEAAVHSEVIGLQPGSTVIDVGTGENPLPLYWAYRGMQVTCTDPDDFVLRLQPLAKQIGLSDAIRQGRLRFEVADGPSLPFPDNSFDFWTSISVVEHIPQDGDTKVMKEAARVLKPGGIAVVTTEGGPNDEEYWYQIENYFGKQYIDSIDDKTQSQLRFINSVENISEFDNTKQGITFALLREYNYSRMLERLVKPSGLEIIEVGFIDSRFKTDFRGAIEAQNPRRPWWGILLAEIVPLITYWSYRRVDDPVSKQPTHASTAYAILRKPQIP